MLQKLDYSSRANEPILLKKKKLLTNRQHCPCLVIESREEKSISCSRVESSRKNRTVYKHTADISLASARIVEDEESVAI